MKEKELSRKEAMDLLNLGWGIIDTSGRTREIKEKSTIALASKTINFSIMYKSNVKNEIINKYKPTHTKEKIAILMHSVGIYYCLKNNISKLPGVFVCSDGFAPHNIKHHLNNLMGSQYDASRIKVYPSLKPMLGKRNIGDRLAYNVNKKGIKPTMLFNAGDIQKFIKSR